jgi:phospholipid/cholesterol/gamma-HCH transport system substrate-binding protein
MRGPIPNFRGHVVTALLGVMFTVVFGGTLLHLSGLLRSDDDYRITALLPSSSALAAQSRVTMAGVPVGRVIKVTQHNGAAAAELAIDHDHGPIPIDSRIDVRLRTLIGEKSLDVVPGSSTRMLADHGVLPLSQGNELVELDQILSELRGATRTRAQQTLQRLGGALDGHGGDLHQIVDDGTTMITRGAPFVRVLAADHRAVTRLVSNLGQVAERIGERGASIDQLASSATTTFRAVAARDDALQRTIHELPAVLEQVRTTAGVLQTTDRVASPVLRRASTAVAALSPTLDLLRPAANQGNALVAELGRSTPPLKRVLTAVRRASNPVAGTFPQLGKTLCQLNPLARYVAPYGKELSAVIQGLGSAVNTYDANGHLARLYIGVGDASVMGLQSPEVAHAINQLTNVGILHKVRLLGYNPYPAPAQANDTDVGRNSAGPFDAENRYPRVQADC